MRLAEGASVIVRRSSLTGNSASIFGATDSSTVVSASTLIGGVGDKNCVTSDNGNGVELSSNYD